MATLVEGPAVSGHSLAMLNLGSATPRLASVFAAIFNSFVFDWFVRLSVAQHMSFNFVEPAPFLREIPLLNVEETVERLLTGDADYVERADLRAELDAAVALGYGLAYDDLSHIVQSFPLIDREEPPVNGESRSTVTLDLLLAAYCRQAEARDPGHAERVRAARRVGALGYVAAPLRKQLPHSRSDLAESVLRPLS